MSSSEQLPKLLFTDNVDVDFYPSLFDPGVAMAVVAGRPVVEPENAPESYEANMFSASSGLSEREHVYATRRLANDAAILGVNVPVFRGAGYMHGGTFTYDGTTVEATYTSTTIPARYHLNPYDQPLIVPPDGPAQPGSLHDAVDFALRDSALARGFDVALCGPATEISILMQVMRARGLTHRLGTLVAQGVFFGGTDAMHLTFGKTFNYGSDVAAGDAVVRDFPGAAFTIPSSVSRAEGVSSRNGTYDPEYPLESLNTKAELETLLGPNLPPLFVERFERHHVLSMPGILLRAADKQIESLNRLPVSFDDAHTVLLLNQVAEGRPQGDPYTWQEVPVPGAAGPRYAVTSVNADRCMELMRALVDPYRTPPAQ